MTCVCCLAARNEPSFSNSMEAASVFEGALLTHLSLYTDVFVGHDSKPFLSFHIHVIFFSNIHFNRII